MRNKIKELRLAANLTQEELAKRAGVRRETIIFLEQSKYNPSLQLAYSISQIFKVPIEKIFIFDN